MNELQLVYLKSYLSAVLKQAEEKREAHTDDFHFFMGRAAKVDCNKTIAYLNADKRMKDADYAQHITIGHCQMLRYVMDLLERFDEIYPGDEVMNAL